MRTHVGEFIRRREGGRKKIRKERLQFINEITHNGTIRIVGPKELIILPNGRRDKWIFNSSCFVAKLCVRTTPIAQPLSSPSFVNRFLIFFFERTMSLFVTLLFIDADGYLPIQHR